MSRKMDLFSNEQLGMYKLSLLLQSLCQCRSAGIATGTCAHDLADRAAKIINNYRTVMMMQLFGLIFHPIYAKLFQKLLPQQMKSLYIFLPLLLLLCFSCKRKPTQWDTDILLPLVSGNVDINNIVTDSLLETQSDNSMELVYQNELYQFNLAEEVIDIPDTSLDMTLKLDSIRLDDRTITHSISLGQIALQAGLVGQIIINNHGMNSVIPPLTDLSSDPVPIDGTEFFETATLDGGFLDILVENGLPIPITDVEFELVNASDSSLILNHIFPSIPAGGVDSVTVDLSGKTVEGNLVAELINISSPGSGGNPVPIDTSDAIDLTMTIRDLEIYEATAIFPAQNLVDFENNGAYAMNGPEFTFMTIRTGILRVDMVSTVEDSIYLTYAIPSATDTNGQMLQVITVIPPAPPGGSATVSEDFQLNGVNIDLTGKDHDTINTFFQTVVARIDSTGRLVNLSLEDSIRIFYGLLDIVPDYVRGYIGQHRVSVGPETVEFDLFNSIRAGSLDLEKVDISMNIDNGLGVGGGFIINQMASVNTKTKNTVVLDGNLPGTLIHINKATDPPLVPANTTIVIDNSNSNATELIENFSDRFSYFGDIFINLNNLGENYTDFAYFDSGLDMSLDITLPLSFIASSLTLSDTIDFNYKRSAQTDNISNGVLTLIADNGFPLEATMQILLYNEHWQLLDSLFSNTFVDAGVVGSSCKVTAPTRSKLVIPAHEERLQIFEQAKQAIILAAFSSGKHQCANEHLKIYSDYKLDVKIVGNFNLSIGDRP